MSEVVIAVIASGFLSSIVTIIATRRKISAEADSSQASAIHSISEAWTNLIAPMEARIRMLENESVSKQEQLRKLRSETECLRVELMAKQREIEALTARVLELERAGFAKDETIEGQACRIRELENEVSTLRLKLKDF